MRKIVVLDGFAANPGDLSWKAVEQLGSLTVWDRTPKEELVSRAEGAEILLTNKTVLDAAALEALPALRYISVLATGWNVVDTAAARRLGIDVSNVPAFSTESVVQMTMAHLLNLASALAVHSDAVRHGKWSSCADFTFSLSPLAEMAGKTLGIVGFGQIGRRVAAAAGALSMKTIAFGPHLRVGERYDGTEAVELDELFAASDVVSLHCPLNPASRAMVDARRLGLMKPTAFLINTARGPLIDETALAGALACGQIAGAGLDVLCQEPPRADNPLLALPNCFITPHNAWATLQARERLMEVTAANLRSYCAGRPQNVVN